MPLTLMSLPPELIQEIASHLLLADQSLLSRTCKSLNSLLTPVVWSDVELHHSGTHEGIDVRGEVSQYVEDIREGLPWINPMDVALPDDKEYPYQGQEFAPSPRKYAQCGFDPSKWSDKFRRRWGFIYGICPSRTPVNGDNNQFGREETFICVRRFTAKQRWDQLAQNVRSLCISIGVDDEFMEGISTLHNLRSLEIVGLALVVSHFATAPKVNLPRLENLKLRGYFPSAFVRQICSNAKHIKHLDLGLLATPTDDVVYGDTILAPRSTRAPLTLAQAEYYQTYSAEAAATAWAPIGPPPEGDNINGAYPEEVWLDEDDEDDEDEPMPWAIHGAIWLPRSLPWRLKSLTHLHLVKPYTGETELDVAGDGFALIPHQYEDALNIEWQLLLEGVGPSLKELILEHRAPADLGDTVYDGDPVPLQKKSKAGWTSPWPIDYDRGDELFCRSVLRLLLERSREFSNLRHLALRGIRIKGLATGTQEDVVPGEHGEPDNDELLRQAYPDCEVGLFEDVYPIHADDKDEYYTGNKNTRQAIHDEGDGLLHSLAFYNDYKKRFGPQWRVPG
ncbi:hypothetical protein BJ166DRAFT_309055 [Pestalotiopsis sp. NC0098]|nr:hypothetical protein BJ166DRAFT_309055 [Pestalotiopsis sp. NC0098]